MITSTIKQTTRTARRVKNSLRDDAGQPMLTRREKEVLLLVANGGSSRNVANELFVSKRTIDFHLASVFAKLAVKNRMQAVNEARRLCLIDNVTFG